MKRSTICRAFLIFRAMKTFLQETIAHIQKEQTSFTDSIWIVPSKRAAGFIKNEFRQKANKTQILPIIYSIEEFIQILSGLKIADSTQMVFECYETYLEIDSITQKEDFDTFSTWVSTLIGDFNEIDRYMLDADSFFDYLNNIQDIEHWYLAEERTELISNYLNFWNSLSELYDKLKEKLLTKGMAHQGLVYRKAAENVKTYLKANSNKTFVFIGFNALNNAEQHIFQTFLEIPNNKIYWDIDNHFVKDTMHGASLFIRKYLETWPYFKDNPLVDIPTNFTKEKEIQLIQAPQNITQVKALSTILEELSPEEKRNTAIVLADETLLEMVLGSLPESIEKVNVTMGASIQYFPAVLFFAEYFSIQQKNQDAYYYKDIFTILQHPMVQANIDKTDLLLNDLIKGNYTYCNLNKILDLYKGKDTEGLKLLFTPWLDDVQLASKTSLELTKRWLEQSKSTSIERVVLFELYKLLENLKQWTLRYPYISTTKTFNFLFTEAIRTTTIDFEGDAYDGLQIMGVLESRLLDFENIILLSVNEGILPSGKSNNSFITYDLKRQYGLPLYTEKDAIYTYHFYRLIQRAKKVWLCYNTDDSGIKGGEPSRFVLQLQVEKLANHKITIRTVSPKVSDSGKVALQTIPKNQKVIDRLTQIAKKGFSPSALGSYIRNPIDFYERRILRIDETDEVEETVAYSTMGTIVHDTLENLYKECNALLDKQSLERIKKKADAELETQFKKSFLNGDYTQGFNLIIYNVAKQFVHRTINYDLDLIQKGNAIEIIELEQMLSAELYIPSINQKVKIYGLADRIERFNGMLRIIDYKTGAVDSTNLSVTDWDKLISDKGKSQAFQVLTYAWLYMQNNTTKNLQAGILSMRKMNNGFMPVRENRGFGDIITKDVVDEFETYLVRLVEEIFDLNEDFKEKEI